MDRISEETNVEPSVNKQQKCPCGTGLTLVACCLPYFSDDKQPPSEFANTAEKLMRSRYTAYVLGINEYISMTWHPSTRPSSSDFCDSESKWLGLKILECSENETYHFVSFVARYKIAGKAHRLEEKSRFVHEDGKWFYLDGEVVQK